MRNTRTNQGGSVVAFMVVGITLAALVVGGVYLAQQRGKEAVKDTPPISQQPKTPVPSPTAPTPSPTPGSTQPKPTTPTTGSQIPSTGYDSSNASTSTAETGSPQPTNLPTTGPVDTTLQILAAAILTAAVIAYVRSDLYAQAAKSL